MIEKDRVEVVQTTDTSQKTELHPSPQEGCYYFERQKHPQPCVKSSEIPRVVSHTKRSDDYFLSLINFAYAIGGTDFMLTLNAENGARNKDLLSYIVGANGYRDQGLCQLNRQHHLPFIESEDFQDPYKQIRYCYDVYRGAELKGRLRTTFYGYNHRHKRGKHFIY